jgi:peroxiredoxin
VRSRILFSLLLLAVLPLTPGCDRGVHPFRMNEPAPDFKVSDGSTSIHLADYKGKVVLLNFWSSTCAPCIEELPALLELHHEHPEIAILAVSVDYDPDSYTRFITRRHVDLITVRDGEQKAAKLYHTEGWPETYVIDRQGFIRRKIVGDPDWSNPEIRAFLKSL